MDTFLFTLQTTNGIIFIWTLFSSPYRQQTELYLHGPLFSSPCRKQTELYLYGHFSFHLIDNKRNNISMGTFLFTIWTTNGIIFIWTLFSTPYRQQMELYLHGLFSLHHIENKRNHSYLDTFLFTICRKQTELYLYGHFSLHHIDNKRNYILWALFSSPYGQQMELYFYGHFSLHHMDNKWNYIYIYGHFLFTLQTTNGIIFMWTLFSSPYRLQTELYLYGHFSLHLIDNKGNYIYVDTVLFTIQTTNGNYIYMDTFLFTLQTTNGIIFLCGHCSLHPIRTTNGIIFIWTLFSSPYRQQTELYFYGHFSLHLIDNKRNNISMGTSLFTIWTTNGIIFIWTLFSSPNRQMK